MSESKSEEDAPMTEEEKYYNNLYTRRQYRINYGQKCSKRVEMIWDTKIDRVKSAQVSLESSSKAQTSETIQSMKIKLELFQNKKDNLTLEKFYDLNIPPLKNINDTMPNIDLKIQRLVRQAEEIREVKDQIQQQEKDDNIYKILQSAV